MTAIYAANEQSLTLLPDLLSAHAIAQADLPAANKHIPFTADIAAATSFSDDVTLYIAEQEALLLNEQAYQDSTIETFCRILHDALPNAMPQEHIVMTTTPPSIPEP